MNAALKFFLNSFINNSKIVFTPDKFGETKNS